MAEEKKKKKEKKEKTELVLPSAFKTLKRQRETNRAKGTYNAIWAIGGFIVIAGLVAFVALGGVSQTGILRFFFNWGNTAGNKVADVIGDTSIVVNEDGIYIDPTGEKGTKIVDDVQHGDADLAIDTVVGAYQDFVSEDDPNATPTEEITDGIDEKPTGESADETVDESKDDEDEETVDDESSKEKKKKKNKKDKKDDTTSTESESEEITE